MKCPHCGAEISRSEFMREIGKITTPKKAKASAENGKKGGRPKKLLTPNKTEQDYIAKDRRTK